jgi:peptidoglycan/xylan/chitin deacetylase (PgdA/CDA1 family)
MVSPIVLMYHRVCADAEWRPSEFVVTASTFRAQMTYLVEHGYYTPRLSEVLRGGGKALRGRRTPVLLTFDDGYRDNLENAVPVLRELGLTGAVFPVLHLSRRFNCWDEAPALRAPLLDAGELREVEEAGMEIGSHTITHPWLTRAGAAQLADELARSREILASIVARPLPVLAYPYGDVDARVKEAVGAAGYSAALAVNSGPLEIGADLLEIRRQRVGNGASEAYLKLILSGAEKLYAWSKWKVRSRLASARRSAGARREASAGAVR